MNSVFTRVTRAESTATNATKAPPERERSGGGAPSARCGRRRSSTRSSRRSISRNTKLRRSPCCARRKRDDSIGVSVNDTSIDTATAKLTVRPNWKKNRPMMPLHERDRDEHRHDATTWSPGRPGRSPRSRSTRPIIGVYPVSRWRWMFSMTTIASSIRMPIDSDSASIVMLLNVKPIPLHERERGHHAGRDGDRADERRAHVAEEEQDDGDREQGAEQEVELHVVDRVLDVGRVVGRDREAARPPCSTRGRSSSSSSRTAFATATVLEPDCLRMTSATADVPSSDDAERGLGDAVDHLGDVARRGSTVPAPAGIMISRSRRRSSPRPWS